MVQKRVYTKKRKTPEKCQKCQFYGTFSKINVPAVKLHPQFQAMIFGKKGVAYLVVFTVN